MNPFENDSEINFAEHLREYFKGKEVGDTFKIDILGRAPMLVRGTLKNCIKQKVKTKVAKDGTFWVKILGEQNEI